MTQNLRIMIVQTRYYDDIADMLLTGAQGAAEDSGAQADVFTVAGALEIPAALKAGLGHYDAFVALGCVIRGETTHYESVSNESARAIMDLTINHDMPIGNGILTVENKDQALTRADHTGKNLGGNAVRAALSLYGVHQEIKKKFKP